MKKRNFKSVDISGVDISAPHIHSKDGACDSIVNMRYNSGTWSNMCSWSSRCTVEDDSPYEILYYHPALDEGEYIARSGDSIEHVSVSSSGQVTSIASLLELETDQSVSISHFGSILYITIDDNEDNIFVWYNDTYSPFDLEGLMPIDDATITPTFISSDADDDDNSEGLTLVAEVECDDNGMALSTTRYDNYHYGLMRSSGYTPGVSYMMIGYRLFDGSIVKCGRVHMLQSESEDQKSDKTLLLRIFDNTYRYYTTLSGAQNRIFFTVPPAVQDSPLITSIVLLATRPQDIYNFDDIYDNFSIDSATSLGGNRYLSSRSAIISDEAESAVYTPYYILEQIDTADIGVSYTLTLDYDTHFSSLHYNEVYEPNFSIHTTRSAAKLDYNNRLHCGNIIETLYDGPCPLYGQSTFSDGSITYSRTLITTHNIFIETTISTDDREIVVRRVVDSDVIYSYNSEYYIVVPNLLAYPDSRATSMRIYYQDSGESSYYKLYSTALQSAAGVNLAWSADFTKNSLMFHNVIKLTTTSPYTPAEVTNQIHAADKVIVSESGNPFVFQPEHTYYLGTGVEVLRLSTSSQQLTESRYGQHPLIVFTSAGIYAFEQGSGDTLYLSTVLISSDVLKSSSDVISIEPYIFYCNERGVMAVSGSSVFSISSQITAAASNSDYVDITKYIDGAYMLYSTLYGELYICNSSYIYGYCFNIAAKKWSMRSIEGSKISDTMVLSGSTLYDLGKLEDSLSPLACSLSTMAIKLVPGSYKHLDAVLAALDAESSTIWSYSIYASNDLMQWYQLRSSTMTRLMRRFASSWQYFRIEVEVSGFTPSEGVGNYFTITGFDLEYYTRFNSHLRGDR